MMVNMHTEHPHPKHNGPLARYAKLRVAHAPGMPGTFSPPPRVSYPGMHHARASRTCRGACQDRYLADSFEVGGGENGPGIPGACATRNFTYLVRGPWYIIHSVPIRSSNGHVTHILKGYSTSNHTTVSAREKYPCGIRWSESYESPRN